MILRKILPVIISCALALSTLTACSTNTSTNYDAADWDRDVKKHWIMSENGKKLENSKHKLVDNICSVCESEVLQYDDGSAEIHNYTEYGDFLRLTNYDADGNITMDTRYEYEYDHNGHVVLKKQYEFDTLVQETEYVVSFEGESIMAMQTSYSEDGSRNISQCDGNGNVIAEIYCDADGFETVTAEYSYTYTTDVDFFLSTKIEYFDDGSKFIIDYNEYGDTIHWYTFDAYGNMVSGIFYEYKYDSDGNMISSTESDGNILTNEYEYALDSEGNSYCIKETVYNENKTATCYEYDENGEVINETTYDTSSNVIW